MSISSCMVGFPHTVFARTLCLVAELVEVIALLAVAEHDAHAAAYVSLWLAEDTDAGMSLPFSASSIL